MLATIFAVICLFSFVWSLIFGSTAQLTPAIFDGAGRAIEVTLSLCGMMTLWSGVLEVLREAGAINKLSRLLRVPMKLVFPRAARLGRGLESAVACITANLLGIGNAATPLGIAALCELQDSQCRENRDEACDDSVMLIVLCSASFSLIPTTVLTLRRAAGAAVMLELLPAVWAVGLFGTLVAICSVRLLRKLTQKRRRGFK